MTVTFRCGHRVTLDRTAQSAPVCACGERVVANVTGATPRFTGACRGPHATFAAVEPYAERLPQAAPLRLQENG